MTVLTPTPEPVEIGGIGMACPAGKVYIAIFDTCLNFGEGIGMGVSWSLVIGAMIALVKFAIGSWQLIMSTGKPTKLSNARATTTDAVLGFIMIAAAWVLLEALSGTFPEEWHINFFVLP